MCPKRELPFTHPNKCFVSPVLAKEAWDPAAYFEPRGYSSNGRRLWVVYMKQAAPGKNQDPFTNLIQGEQ